MWKTWKTHYLLYVPTVLASTFCFLKMWKMWNFGVEYSLFNLGFHVFELIFSATKWQIVAILWQLPHFGHNSVFYATLWYLYHTP